VASIIAHVAATATWGGRCSFGWFCLEQRCCWPPVPNNGIVIVKYHFAAEYAMWRKINLRSFLQDLAIPGPRTRLPGTSVRIEHMRSKKK